MIINKFSIILVSIFIYFQTSFLHSASIDEGINEVLSPVSNFVAGIVFYSVNLGDFSFPLIVVWLIVAALYCTFYFGFINIKGFGTALSFLTSKKSEKNAPGEVTHRQALWTATAATVGLGNIAGVAIAVSLGGPGATFWMILAGFLGMSLKFCECTLGVKYRVINSDGTVSGGPMYYLSRGLKEIGFERLGKFLAIMFSICCIGGALGGGNMFQANQSYQQFVGITGGENSFFDNNAWLYGLILAVLLGTVIIGGIKSIARVTEKLVPFMAIIYILCALTIIFLNFGLIGEAFRLIFVGAFTGEGITGGVIGVLIQGFKRAAFSNEAGLGSAPIAHSAVKTNYPITEGYVALLEPFIDTVIICTMTALVIIITGMHLNTEGYGGIQLTSEAFAKDISWFPYILAVSAILFAFSTMISWSYYGLKSWTYLLGKSKVKENVFKLIFCLFVIIGSSLDLASVVDLSDSMIFLMALFNIVGVYLLISKVREELIDYKRIKSSE
ncbi:alanine:cation symporter family protein [Alphaproteobacteria bacterium]|nr:alanine:cation symporter family protein [Alphaproteobacteria bacterium]